MERGQVNTVYGAGTLDNDRLLQAQAGLSESRRIARQRLAIRDSVKMSALAIR